jgi:DNA modification methylase
VDAEATGGKMASDNHNPQSHTRSLLVEYRRASSLKMNTFNPRIHSERQISQIAGSIRAFGFNVPILVRTDGLVIAGHGRLLAAKESGLEEVPTICLDHLSENQIKAYMLADNRLTENSTWDDRLLAEQLKALAEAELEFDIELTGFEMGEIDVYIEGLMSDDDRNNATDAVPDASSEPLVTRPGDLWCLGNSRVLCGDALDTNSYPKLLGGVRAAVVFVDPPYNVPIDGHATGLGSIHHREFAMASGEMSKSEFTDFLQKALRLLAQNSLDGSIHYVCMDWRHMGELLAAGEAVYDELKNVCVWAKDNAGMGSFYRSQHEMIFVFKHGTGPHRNNIQLGRMGRYRSNLWSYSGMNSFSRSTAEGDLLTQHPTVKPVSMVADAIMDSSARGEVVLDSFLGSGTALLAAERVGRVCYGIELEPQYVDIAVRRWQTLTGKAATLESTGKTFAQRQEEVGSGR